MKHAPFPPRRSISLDELIRFWSKIERTETCWLWTGASTRAIKFSGLRDEPYGAFCLRGKTYLPHRFAYFIHYNVDPGDFIVMHDCNITLCVRPEHLLLGTQAENLRYRSECGRNPVGSLVGGSKLTETDIPKIRLLRKQGFTIATIANVFRVSKNAISRVLNEETWKHVS